MQMGVLAAAHTVEIKVVGVHLLQVEQEEAPAAGPAEAPMVLLA